MVFNQLPLKIYIMILDFNLKIKYREYKKKIFFVVLQIYIYI